MTRRDDRDGREPTKYRQESLYHIVSLHVRALTHLAPPNWRPRRLSSFCRLFDSTFSAVRPLRNASIIPREACSGAYSIIVSHHSPLTRQFPWKLRKRSAKPSNSRLHAVRVAGDEGMRGPRFADDVTGRVSL